VESIDPKNHESHELIQLHFDKSVFSQNGLSQAIPIQSGLGQQISEGILPLIIIKLN
jgi:hypothetical protein